MPMTPTNLNHYNAPDQLDLSVYDIDEVVTLSSSVLQNTNVLFINSQPTGLTLVMDGDRWPLVIYVVNGGANPVTIKSGSSGMTGVSAAISASQWFIIPAAGFLLPVS